MPIPEAITVYREELLRARENWRRILDGAEKQLELATSKLETIDFVITACWPDGDDALVATHEIGSGAEDMKRKPKLDLRTKTLEVVHGGANRLTAKEIANTISEREKRVVHEPRIANWLVKLQRDNLVKQAEDGRWDPVEIPPAAPFAVDADPDREQAALEKPLEVPLPRKGSRVSTSPLKHTNPPAAAKTPDEARDFITRCGDMGAGDWQIDRANARDGLMALIAQGIAEKGEDDRYRLRIVDKTGETAQ